MHIGSIMHLGRTLWPSVKSACMAHLQLCMCASQPATGFLCGGFSGFLSSRVTYHTRPSEQAREHSLFGSEWLIRGSAGMPFTYPSEPPGEHSLADIEVHWGGRSNRWVGTPTSSYTQYASGSHVLCASYAAIQRVI